MKPVKKFFVYKCKLSLSLALLYLVDLFINKLKTKFNNLFYRIILNTNRIHNSFWRNFPARAKQSPSKVLFVAKTKATTAAVRSSRAKLEMVSMTWKTPSHNLALRLAVLAAVFHYTLLIK